MGNYGRRGGVNKGLECVIAFAIALVQSPSLGHLLISATGVPPGIYNGTGAAVVDAIVDYRALEIQ